MGGGTSQPYPQATGPPERPGASQTRPQGYSASQAYSTAHGKPSNSQDLSGTIQGTPGHPGKAAGQKPAALGATMKSEMLDAIHEHKGGINCMALSEDASILVTGSEDRSLRLWTTKTVRCDCIGVMVGHQNYISCVLIEEQYVVSASADCTVRKWDMGTCECVLVFKGHTGRVNRILTTGDFIFSSSVDKTIRSWDFDRGTCIREFVGHQNGVFPLVFVPADDDDFMFSSIKDLDAVDGRATAALQQVNDIVISGSTDNTARAWSFETGRCIRTFRGHTGAVTCVATDPDGDTLFTASTDFTLRSWMVNTGECLRVFNGHQASIICLTVVDKIVYSGSADYTARAWHPDQSEAIAVFKGHEETIMCIRHYDGNILTGGGDGAVVCFNSKTGSVQQIFNGPSKFIINCMQVVDGRVFTGAADGILRLWAMSDYGNFFSKDFAQRLANTTIQPRLNTDSQVVNSLQGPQVNGLSGPNVNLNGLHVNGLQGPNTNDLLPQANRLQNSWPVQPSSNAPGTINLQPQHAPYLPSSGLPYVTAPRAGQGYGGLRPSDQYTGPYGSVNRPHGRPIVSSN